MLLDIPEISIIAETPKNSAAISENLQRNASKTSSDSNGNQFIIFGVSNRDC